MTSNFDKLLEMQRNMKSRRHPKDEEHRLQVACVRWFRMQYPHLREMLFAVPNGGRRDEKTGARLKEEGVIAGVSDLILLQRNDNYGALLIEMKTKTGRQSESQKRWQQTAEEQGYRYVVCRSLEEFMKEVNNYQKKTIIVEV